MPIGIFRKQTRFLRTERGGGWGRAPLPERCVGAQRYNKYLGVGRGWDTGGQRRGIVGDPPESSDAAGGSRHFVYVESLRSPGNAGDTLAQKRLH